MSWNLAETGFFFSLSPFFDLSHCRLWKFGHLYRNCNKEETLPLSYIQENLFFSGQNKKKDYSSSWKKLKNALSPYLINQKIFVSSIKTVLSFGWLQAFSMKSKFSCNFWVPNLLLLLFLILSVVNFTNNLQVAFFANFTLT